MIKEDYPRKGELVVCVVKSIKNYGSFVDLPEYNKEGFIHVSQVSSGWVKNIRSHISEGQILVASVTRVDMSKNLIDLSRRGVSQSQEKRRLAQWKRNKRGDKLLAHIAKTLGSDLNVAYETVGWKLQKEFGEIYAAFEAASADGDTAFEGMDLPKEWVDSIVSTAKEKVTPPSVIIRGKLKMVFYNEDGLALIKNVARIAAKCGVSFCYSGAGEYCMSVTAPDYLKAEKVLKDCLSQIESEAKKARADFSFERDPK
ncbi:MAG: translation initiation factor IF-2 subunit alpha [Candidatus Diapherotrites archaeon]|nr:translation initiation factor IF-2 subunit alpha [Candidatus Diapherotrites archaeon]